MGCQTFRIPFCGLNQMPNRLALLESTAGIFITVGKARLEIGLQRAWRSAWLVSKVKLYIYYALRAAEWIEFESLCCKTNLHAIRSNGSERFTVFETEKFTFNFKRQAAVGDANEVVPVENLDDVIKDGPYSEYPTIFRIATRGNHGFMLSWMSNLIGELQCPACKAQSRVNLSRTGQ